jgi:hypothetical protein
MYIGLFGDIKHDFHVTPMSQRQNCQRLGPIKNKERKKKKATKNWRISKGLQFFFSMKAVPNQIGTEFHIKVPYYVFINIQNKFSKSKCKP